MEKKLAKEESRELPISFFQKLYDSPIVLLIMGLVVMFGFYTIWGMFEIMSLKPAPLP